MTYHVINGARFVGALVTGRKKAPMIHRIVNGTDTPREIPIKGIAPTGGELRWYLDADAARWPV